MSIVRFLAMENVVISLLWLVDYAGKSQAILFINLEINGVVEVCMSLFVFILERLLKV